MAAVGTKTRWRRALRFTFGGALCLLAGINVMVGSAWYISLGVAAAGGMTIIGRRRIFHAGVSRSGDEIVCRYVPWYEGSAFLLNILIPLLGVAMVAAGYAPGNPVWLRFAGITLLVLTPLFTYSAVRMWRRCFLRISPSTLTIQLAGHNDKVIEIWREQVQSITPKIVPIGISDQSLQAEIAYRAKDSGSDTNETVLFGPQLSVQPNNLLDALVAWKDATDENPNALLDRIERILRGREMADV